MFGLEFAEWTFRQRIAILLTAGGFDMDADAFRAARLRLRFTEEQFAQSFGVSRRTVQNWSAKGPPAYIGELLQHALASKILPPERALPGSGEREVEDEDAAVKLIPVLDEFLHTAQSAGWPKKMVIAVVQRWAAEH